MRLSRSGKALGLYLAIIIVLVALGWWAASRWSPAPAGGSGPTPADADPAGGVTAAGKASSPDFDPKAGPGQPNTSASTAPGEQPASAAGAAAAGDGAGDHGTRSDPAARGERTGGDYPFYIPGTAERQRPGEELLASEKAPRRQRIAPSWQAGERWLVESYYANIAAPQPDAVWRGPVTWRFDVQQRLRTAAGEEFVVAVQEVQRDGSPLPPQIDDDGEVLDEALPAAVFHVDAQTHRLLKTLIPRREQGEVRMVETDLSDEDGASGARYTLIPFDLPNFEDEAVVIETAEGPDLDVHFDRGPKQLKTADVMDLGPGYLKIEFPRAQDQTPVTQRWAARDMRWPVLSYTRTTRSYRRKDL